MKKEVSEMEGIRIAFCVTGSFCTLSKILAPLQALKNAGASIQPIFSEMVANTDTRFWKAQQFKDKVEQICENKIWISVPQAEPIGPKDLFDITVVAPCTGNTLGKIANGITDSAPLMAVKATLRNQKPIVLGLSTNDGLSGSARNLGTLLNTRHIYFVPFGQDDSAEKPTSLVAHMNLLPETISRALQNKQIQPLLQ